MAFYPFVSPGDQVNPDSRLENDIRRLVNNFNSIGGAKFSGKSSDKISVPVYNATDSVIQRGASVEAGNWDNHILDSRNPLPIRIAPAESEFWGVLSQTLAPNECGDVVLMGIANTYRELYLPQTNRLSPDGKGGYRGDVFGNGIFVASEPYYFHDYIFLGQSIDKTSIDPDRPWKITFDHITETLTVTGGFYKTSGNIIYYYEKETIISKPNGGYICFRFVGESRTPVVQIIGLLREHDAYPLGKIHILQNGYQIYDFRVVVALMG